MCPLRHTLLPRTAGLYMTTVLNTEGQDRGRTLGQRAGLYPSHTKRQNILLECVYVFKTTLSLAQRDPSTQRLWLDSPAFYSTLLRLLTDAHT